MTPLCPCPVCGAKQAIVETVRFASTPRQLERRQLWKCFHCRSEGEIRTPFLPGRLVGAGGVIADPTLSPRPSLFEGWLSKEMWEVKVATAEPRKRFDKEADAQAAAAKLGTYVYKVSVFEPPKPKPPGEAIHGVGEPNRPEDQGHDS